MEKVLNSVHKKVYEPFLTKMFCKNKNSKKITAISHENRAKNLKKKTATTIMKKGRLIIGVEFVCLRHVISTKNNVNKKSLTVFEATQLDCSKVF